MQNVMTKEIMTDRPSVTTVAVTTGVYAPMRKDMLASLDALSFVVSVAAMQPMDSTAFGPTGLSDFTIIQFRHIASSVTEHES